ncbi:hypothetical protein ANO11243_092330 [Dothideomycetidae sp. 11243]|nr:hypothetical protein ANO11243_092330 [fungal sp. No.11243]
MAIPSATAAVRASNLTEIRWEILEHAAFDHRRYSHVMRVCKQWEQEYRHLRALNRIRNMSDFTHLPPRQRQELARKTRHLEYSCDLFSVEARAESRIMDELRFCNLRALRLVKQHYGAAGFDFSMMQIAGTLREIERMLDSEMVHFASEIIRNGKLEALALADIPSTPIPWRVWAHQCSRLRELSLSCHSSNSSMIHADDDFEYFLRHSLGIRTIRIRLRERTSGLVGRKSLMQMATMTNLRILQFSQHVEDDWMQDKLGEVKGLFPRLEELDFKGSSQTLILFLKSQITTASPSLRRLDLYLKQHHVGALHSISKLINLTCLWMWLQEQRTLPHEDILLVRTLTSLQCLHISPGITFRGKPPPPVWDDADQKLFFSGFSRLEHISIDTQCEISQSAFLQLGRANPGLRYCYLFLALDLSSLRLADPALFPSLQQLHIRSISIPKTRSGGFCPRSIHASARHMPNLVSLMVEQHGGIRNPWPEPTRRKIPAGPTHCAEQGRMFDSLAKGLSRARSSPGLYSRASAPGGTQTLRGISLTARSKVMYSEGRTVHCWAGYEFSSSVAHASDLYLAPQGYFHSY